MTLTPEKKQQIREWAKKRLSEGKQPLTSAGRDLVKLRKEPPANKRPA